MEMSVIKCNGLWSVLLNWVVFYFIIHPTQYNSYHLEIQVLINKKPDVFYFSTCENIRMPGVYKNNSGDIRADILFNTYGITGDLQ